jgi:hypothetical protein
MTDAEAIARVIELLKKSHVPKWEKKLKNIQHAIRKETFEKIFWQRKCKFYAPNRMDAHYQELDEELKKADLYLTPNSQT